MTSAYGFSNENVMLLSKFLLCGLHVKMFMQIMNVLVQFIPKHFISFVAIGSFL